MSVVTSHCTATIDVLLALQTHFQAGCVHLLQSYNATGEICISSNVMLTIIVTIIITDIIIIPIIAIIRAGVAQSI